MIIRTFQEQVGRELLEEELRTCGIKVCGKPLAEIFDALVEAYQRGQWVILARLLGCSTPAQARSIVRVKLPRILAAHPRLLQALQMAAGAEGRFVDLETQRGGRMKTIPEERRVALIQKFWEDFSALMQVLEPREVGVEFTGSPASLVLLDLVRRYFRGRFLVDACFPRPPDDIPGLAEYMEQIRAFFGLDPIEPTPKTYAALVKERGWRVLARAVTKGDEVADPPENIEAEVVAFLEGWSPDEIRSYINMQNLVGFEIKREKKPTKKAAEEVKWTRDSRGRYRRNGKLVKESEVPEEVKTALNGGA